MKLPRWRRRCLATVLTIAPGILFAAEHAASTDHSAEPSMTHRMMILVLQLGLILFVAKLGAGLFKKLKLPSVLGEIAAGIMIGPYLLGSIALPGMPHGLFPTGGLFPVSPELYGFCTVAAIVLLFDAGLETDVRLFLRYSVAGSLVGLGGVIVSFVLGDLTAVWFSHLLFEQPIGFFTPAALFLGVMSTATSVGITARLLSERNKIDSPEGVTILAGAVIDDVLGIILLAVTMGVIAASRKTGSVDWGHIGVISAKAVTIWLVATVAGLATSHRISFLLKLFRSKGTIAIMALGLGLIMAGLFEEAGLAMIIGAYVMGLSLSRTDICHLVREKLEPISALLVPVFFVVMGMLVDIHLITSARVLAFGGLYTVLAVVAKVGGCALPAVLCGFNWRGALRVGVGMLPRGEVALIVAGIGLAAGVVGKDVFGVGVLMTLVTTLVAPPALQALLKSDVPGSRHPAKTQADKTVRFPFPSRDAVEIMTTKILAMFEEDDFFVHTLNRDEAIYQMRKHDSVVTMRQNELELVFDCGEGDLAFVHTVVLEVVSDLRRMAAELAKPIESVNWTNGSAGAPRGKSPSLLLSAHLDEAVLDPALTGNTKSELIRELVELAARSGWVKDVNRAVEAVMQREQSGSTGMQFGVALPHGRTDAVDQIVGAVGLKRGGVDFDSMDGIASTIFVMVLSPMHTSGPHVRFLAAASQVLDEAGRRALLDCKTAADMYRVLSTPR